MTRHRRAGLAATLALAAAAGASRPATSQSAHPEAPSVSGVAAAPPPWASLAEPYDGFRVVVGEAGRTAWPGGGQYGAVSAITGAVAVPAAADADLASPGVSRTIVNAGVTGLAITYSRTAPAVGLYGGAGLGREGGLAWGANLTAKNFASSAPGGSPPFNGLIYALEGDLALRRPAGGWAGSNVDGIWLPLDADSQPDGEANMLHVGAVGAAAWKNAVKIDGGAADFAREVGALTRGAGPSAGIPDHYVVRDRSGQVVHVVQGYDEEARLVLRPLTPGAPGGLHVQDPAGRNRITLDGAAGDVVLAGAVVSAGAHPRAACAGAVLDPAATDLRGRVTLPPGMRTCTVVLAAPVSAAPYVVVSADVPGVAAAVLPPAPGEAGRSFTVGLPEGVRVPVAVTWISIR